MSARANPKKGASKLRCQHCLAERRSLQCRECGNYVCERCSKPRCRVCLGREFDNARHGHGPSQVALTTYYAREAPEKIYGPPPKPRDPSRPFYVEREARVSPTYQHQSISHGTDASRRPPAGLLVSDMGTFPIPREVLGEPVDPRAFPPGVTFWQAVDAHHNYAAAERWLMSNHFGHARSWHYEALGLKDTHLDGEGHLVHRYLRLFRRAPERGQLIAWDGEGPASGPGFWPPSNGPRPRGQMKMFNPSRRRNGDREDRALERRVLEGGTLSAAELNALVRRFRDAPLDPGSTMHEAHGVRFEVYPHDGTYSSDFAAFAYGLGQLCRGDDRAAVIVRARDVVGSIPNAASKQQDYVERRLPELVGYMSQRDVSKELRLLTRAAGRRSNPGGSRKPPYGVEQCAACGAEAVLRRPYKEREEILCVACRRGESRRKAGTGRRANPLADVLAGQGERSLTDWSAARAPSASTARVLGTLAHHETVLTLPQLIQESGLSAATIRKAVAELAARRFAVIERSGVKVTHEGQEAAVAFEHLRGTGAADDFDARDFERMEAQAYKARGIRTFHPTTLGPTGERARTMYRPHEAASPKHYCASCKRGHTPGEHRGHRVDSKPYKVGLVGQRYENPMHPMHVNKFPTWCLDCKGPVAKGAGHWAGRRGTKTAHRYRCDTCFRAHAEQAQATEARVASEDRFWDQVVYAESGQGSDFPIEFVAAVAHGMKDVPDGTMVSVARVKLKTGEVRYVVGKEGAHLATFDDRQAAVHLRSERGPGRKTIPRSRFKNPSPGPRGNCYRDAYRKVKELSALFKGAPFLVHGAVYARSLGKTIPHAWVELPNGAVFEPQSGQTFSPGTFDGVSFISYSAEQAKAMLDAHKHYGPWDERSADLIRKSGAYTQDEIERKAKGQKRKNPRPVKPGNEWKRMEAKGRLWATHKRRSEREALVGLPELVRGLQLESISDPHFFWVVAPSTYPGHGADFQITWFSTRTGEPVPLGHSNARTLKKALERVTEDAGGPVRRVSFRNPA